MVLVTGGTGFVGSYIVKALVEKNYRVRAIRRPSSKLPFYIPSDVLEKVEWVEGDVLDIASLEDAMADIDTVIHAAAVVSFYKKDRARLHQVNVQGTGNVVNTMIDKRVARLVHVSSVAALGRTRSPNDINEETKWQDNSPHTFYALSKFRAEMEVWRGIGEGLNAVIVNPSTVLGFGDWNATSCRIFKTIYEEFPWYTQGVNGFVDIDDVAKVTLLLMESNISEQRFILNGDNWSFQRLFNAIADGFGKKKPTIRATAFLGSVAWRLEHMKSLFSGRSPILTQESARVAVSQNFFRNDKLLAALPGFSFTPLQESITKTCKKYLQAINQLQR